MDECPTPETLPPEIFATLAIISGRWKIPTLWLLWKRTHRFGELKKSLPGVTQHMLTATLRELEADRLVDRTVFAEIPPRVEYTLTKRGRSLGEVFVALRDWGAAITSGTVDDE